MRLSTIAISTLACGIVAAVPMPGYGHGKPQQSITNYQVGQRPFYLVENMDPSKLKPKLQSCTEKNLHRTDFAISHRGAPLQFPEHTREGMLAAARMGAGIIECDVTFTKDRELVCRHSQCDLHTTTNILTIPELAAKCNTSFTPAADGKPASAECCTSDITLAEFKSLCGKRDAFNEKYIALIDSLGLKFTPELKTPSVAMPYEGDYTQEIYAQQMIDDYKEAGISPRRVWAQSFLPDDIFYWIKAEPAFGKQAVYLDERVDTPEGYQTAVDSLPDLAKKCVKIMAPPIFALLNVSAENQIIPSEYAIAAKAVGLDIIAWSLERSGPIVAAAKEKEYYIASVASALNNDGDLYTAVDVLARQVGVIGMFSDWPATVVYYANCFGL